MTPPSVVAVVPTYDERANLPLLVEALLRYDNVRVLVVDDQSPDGTGEVADDLVRAHAGRVDVIHRSGPRGLGRSYVDGLRWALDSGADLICQMDADFSHDPDQLPVLLAAAGLADVVIGSRYIPGGAIVNWPASRRVLSRFANVYIRAVTRLRARDCTSGYRCWRREALAALPLVDLTSDGYSFLIELLFAADQQGWRIAEVPITFVERRAGESKLSRAVLVESALTPWRLAGTRRGRGMGRR